MEKKEFGKIIVFIFLILSCRKVVFAQSDLDSSYKYSIDYKNIIPGLPESGNLGAYGNLHVNTSSGVPDVSFNLYTLIKDGVSIPVSISYSADGIKYSDLSSCVGLKWNLNAGGSINRRVNGYSDEMYLYENLSAINNDSVINTYSNPVKYNDATAQNIMKLLAKNQIDYSLDQYYYTLPDRQGELMIDSSGNFIADKDYGLLKILKPDTLFSSFTAIDEKGNRYVFSVLDRTAVKVDGKYTSKSNFGFAAVVGWKLKKIITVNNKEIDFDYATYSYQQTTVDGRTYTSYTTAPPPTVPPSDCGCGTNEERSINATYLNSVAVLTKIRSDDAEIDFIYTDDTTLSGWQRKLTQIKVFSTLNNSVIKSFSFTYGKTQRNYLELSGFSENDGTFEIKKYGFLYYHNGHDFSPPASFNRDYFGYYNGQDDNTTLFDNKGIIAQIQYTGAFANRQISATAIYNGMLKAVSYPSGGQTFFYYEPNITIQNNDTLYAPGVRIKEIADLVSGIINNDRKFFYSDLNGGVSSGSLPSNLHPIQAGSSNSCGVTEMHSEPDSRNLASYFYYGQVLTQNSSKSDKTFTKEIYIADADLYGDIKGRLRQINYYRNDTDMLVRTVKYGYDYKPVTSEIMRIYTLKPPQIITGDYYITILR